MFCADFLGRNGNASQSFLSTRHGAGLENGQQFCTSSKNRSNRASFSNERVKTKTPMRTWLPTEESNKKSKTKSAPFRKTTAPRRIAFMKVHQQATEGRAIYLIYDLI